MMRFGTGLPMGMQVTHGYQLPCLAGQRFMADVRKSPERKTSTQTDQYYHGITGVDAHLYFLAAYKPGLVRFSQVETKFRIPSQSIVYMYVCTLYIYLYISKFCIHVHACMADRETYNNFSVVHRTCIIISHIASTCWQISEVGETPPLYF